MHMVFSPEVSEMRSVMKKRSLITALVLALLFTLILGCMTTASAAGTPKFSGAITVFRLYSGGDNKPGVSQSYKVTVNKAGVLTASLTDTNSGATRTVQTKSCPSSGSTLITVPGSLIADDHIYTVTLVMTSGSKTIGTGSAVISTKKAVSRIDSLSVSPSVSVMDGSSFKASFSLPDDASVTCYIANSSNETVTTLASATSMNAGSHTLTWSGVRTDGSLAPSGTYYMHISCKNSGGTYTAPVSSFTLESTSDDILLLAVKGSINTAFFTSRPHVSQKAVLMVNAAKAGNYKIKLSDSTAGKNYVYSGSFKAGNNRVSIPGSVFIEGHKYKMVLVEASGSSTIGQAACAFVPLVDPPVLSACYLGTIDFDGETYSVLPIGFTLNINSRVNISIKDKSGNVAASVKNGVVFNPGNSVIYWNGTDESGEHLPSGEYTVCISASNSAGSVTAPELSFSYSVSGNTISVKTAGKLDYALFKKAPKVGYDAYLTVGTYAASNYVLTISDATAGKTNTYKGSLSKGESVISIPAKILTESHKYKLQLSIYSGKTLTGKGALSFVPTIDPPSITDFSLGADNMDAMSETGLAIRFTNDLSANTTITICDNEGKAIATILKGARYAPGSHTVNWYGISDAGTLLPTGTYTADITCSNSAGDDIAGPLSFTYTAPVESLRAEVKGVIRYAMFKQTPKVGSNAAFFVDVSTACKYAGVLTDLNTKKVNKLVGSLKAGVNRITIPAAYLFEGHKYNLSLSVATDKTIIGKASSSFIPIVDPPLISNLAPVVTTVNGDDGVTLPIRYTLSIRATVNLYIRDAMGEIIYTVENDVTHNEGTVTVYWDGRDTSGNRLEAGEYRITMTAANSAGSDFAGPVTFTYTRDDATKTPQALGRILLFNVVGDSRPLEQQPVQLRILAKSKGSLKISLLNLDTKSTKVISTLDLKSPSAMTTIPGTNLLGYHYAVQALLYSSGGVKIGSAICYVNPQRIPAEVTQLKATEIFDPSNGDTLIGSVTIATRGNLTVRIKDSEGNIVRKIFNSTKSNSGTATFSWNGKSDSGSKMVPNGEYVIEAFYTDLYGVTTEIKTVNVKVERIPPEITRFSLAETLDVQNDDALVGSVTTSTRGYVYVVVKDASGNIVRKVLNGKKITSGTVKFVWDGRRESGTKVPSGKYTVSAYYIDTYGDTSETKTTIVRVGSGIYPDGVYGYKVVGAGNAKTKIYLFNGIGGSVIGYTYGQSAVFRIFKTFDDYVYAEVGLMTNDPIRCYVKISNLEQIVVTSPYRIEISTDRTGSKAQRMWVYKDGSLVDTFLICTGIVEGSTPRGSYLITDRMPYFYNTTAKCEHALRVVGGVCIHRVPFLEGQYLESYLGKVASHGCIRVPLDKSEWLYSLPDTTQVYIFNSKG